MNITTKTLKASALAAFAAIALVAAGAEEAQAILDRAAASPSPPATEGTMKMVLVDRNGGTRERTITSYSVSLPNGDTKRTMVFEAPADVRGTRFLTIAYDAPEKDDEQYIFIPALRKVRSIGTSGGDSKTGAFLGSDFTYADLGSLDAPEFSAVLLGEETVDGTRCWKIEQKAANPEVVKKYGYSRVIKWIDSSGYALRKAEYHNRDGKLAKRLAVGGYETLAGKYRIFTSMTMANLESGTKTTLEFTGTKALDSIDPNYFTVRFLERGR
ncbi:MAG: outer membrane lipoprotein-sorting protein [Spirochaetes bacterium]|nr:outer membrane lipoprotein-sorting protein [Spirochaetota bacterium]